MTDKEIFDLAKAARLTQPSSTVSDVAGWRGSLSHPIAKTLLMRFGVDIVQPLWVEYPQDRVGIAHVCFNAIGGTETWTRMFAKHVAGLSGVATLDRPLGWLDVPLYHGDEAIRALCRSSRTVLVWGITGVHRHLFESPRPQKLLAVCHGAPNSRWACEVFENQLRWCDGGVAVHPEMAKKYDVPWIPNIVEDLGQARRWIPPALRRVSWIHRPSAEKRPEFAIEIAKYLHRDCKLMATLGEGYPTEKLHDKVINIGMITEPAKRQIVLEASDVFLATPTDEGFGYSVAEAVERLVPVVSSPHGIAQEFAEVTLRTNEPAEWAEAIQFVQRTMPIERLERRRDELLKVYGSERVRRLWDVVL